MSRLSLPKILIILLIASVLLLFVVGTAFSTGRAAAGQTLAGLAAPPAQGGRDLSRADWIAHIPLAGGAALLVIVVDAVFITKIMRDRRKAKRTGTAAVRK